MIASSITDSHAVRDDQFGEPYLWRGGRFLTLYTIIMVQAIVALAIRLL